MQRCTFWKHGLCEIHHIKPLNAQTTSACEWGYEQEQCSNKGLYRLFTYSGLCELWNSQRDQDVVNYWKQQYLKGE